MAPLWRLHNFSENSTARAGTYYNNGGTVIGGVVVIPTSTIFGTTAYYGTLCTYHGGTTYARDPARATVIPF